MSYRIPNLIGFQVGWLCCVIGAGNALPWLGPVAAAVLVTAHLYVITRRYHEITLLLSVAAVGITVDSTLGAFGVFDFAQSWPAAQWLAPPWLIALWLLFAATLRHGLDWLLPRPWLAAALGAIGGPMAYLGGERLGAAALPLGYGASLATLAVVWAFLMPSLCRLAARSMATQIHQKTGEVV